MMKYKRSDFCTTHGMKESEVFPTINTKELEQSVKLVEKQNESSWLSSVHFMPIKSVT